MKVCPKCGFSDNPKWRHSRFDYDADYMRFDEAHEEPELLTICTDLDNRKNFDPVALGRYYFYRRGTGGIYLYRVLKEDFRVPRERKSHKNRSTTNQKTLF